MEENLKKKYFNEQNSNTKLEYYIECIKLIYQFKQKIYSLAFKLKRGWRIVNEKVFEWKIAVSCRFFFCSHFEFLSIWLHFGKRLVQIMEGYV